MNLAHPLISSGIAPFAVSLIAAVALGRIFKPSTVESYLGMALYSGLWTGLVAFTGLPSLLPHTALDKLSWITFGVALLCVATTRRNSGGIPDWLIGTALSLSGIAWIAVPVLANPGVTKLAVGAALATPWIFFTTQSTARRERSALFVLLVADAALVYIAFMGNTLVFAQLASALVAATFGVMFGSRILGCGVSMMAAVHTCAAASVTLGTSILLFSDATPAGLLCITLAFAALPISTRLSLSGRFEMMLVVAISSISAAFAIGLARSAQSGGSLYYH